MEAPGLFHYVLALAGFYLTPLLAVAVSAVYFFSSPASEPLVRRMLASAHGATIAILYVGAMLVAEAGFGDIRHGRAYDILIFVPAVFIVTSFFLFRGKKRIHGLQIVNILCLLWTWFVGFMAVTGRWL